MQLLHIFLVVAMLCSTAQLSAQYVDDRAAAIRLRSNVTGYTLSIQPSTATSTPYQLLFVSQSPAMSSLWISDADQRVEWLAPGASGNILTSDGTNLSWQHPFATNPGWLTNGTGTLNSWDGTSGAMAGPLTVQPFSLVTRSAAAQPILLYTGTNAGSERMRIASTGGVLIGTTSALANTQLSVANVANMGNGIDVDANGTTLSSGVIVRSIGNTATADAGIVIGSSSNGTGTAIRIGSGSLLNSPSQGIEVNSASPIQASPTTTASGTGLLVGSSVQPWQQGFEGWSEAGAVQIARSIQSDASSASASVSIGMYARIDLSTGGVLPMVTSSQSNADVYLGSSLADLPSGLSLLALGANTNTTRMHNFRASGQLTFRGTGTGVTTLAAGAQGATDITYTLPTSGPTASNTVLIAGPSGVMTWANAAGLADILMEETLSDGDLMRSPQYRKHVVMDVSNIDDYSVNLNGGWSLTTGRYNGILGGDTAQIWYEPVGATVVSGNLNYIMGCNHSAIVGGYRNMLINGLSLSGGSSCFIGSGALINCGTSNYQGIVTGSGNDIDDGRQSSLIGTGEENIIRNSARSTIVNGYFSRIEMSDDVFSCSVVELASFDGLVDLSHRGSIIAGTGRIRNSTDALIATSWASGIESSANRSAVVSSDRCSIDLSTDATILSGTDVEIVLSAHNSTVISGSRLRLESGNICVLGNGGSGTMNLSQQDCFVLANIPLVLASNSAPSEFRFYEGQGTQGIFPNVNTSYVGLRAAAAHNNDHTYDLPVLPSNSGRVLTCSPVAALNIMSWVDLAGVWRTNGSDVSSSAQEISSLNGPLTFATTHITPSDIRFYVGSLGGLESMRIRGADGNVGIGTTNPAQRLAVNGTARLGENGTTLNSMIKTTVSVNLPSLAAGESHTEDVAVANTTVTDAIKVSALSSIPDGLLITWSRVSSAGTVSIGFVNTTGSAVDPPSVDFCILAIQ